ncbi:DNA helicase UvrD [Pontibacillus chungwhensis BH030062]|uniref:DNA 3'-5' helicase n=1 Tax=Pontibacillus chungwhensis BH030062 TaxID=1385513 RepID=A0A0A2UZ03_9BACI|nr:ATP-dependent helicase [Pontibacillus chungwhensis]KGP91756.1 DNA helicase UvrD [Pontibacillus chungwhensis BH030062]
MIEHTDIKDKITEIHGDDKSQLDVIFSDGKKIMVEAPAGYGKTQTLISKIAYDIVAKKIKNYKKILVITFSVNAAHKVKKDIKSKLPVLLQDALKPKPKEIDGKVVVSNYHGFCRGILKKYGYLLHQNLKEVDSFKIFNTKEEIGLTKEELKVISKFEHDVRIINYAGIEQNKHKYLKILIKKLLDNKYITYDGIILLTELLLKNYPSVLKFYQSIFQSIVIDEFQDTNVLSWELMNLIISDKSNVQFYGDSLQKIYGFIGAIPNLLDDAAEKFDMEYHHLKYNYRFKDNKEMLLLDNNIREIAKNPINPNMESESEVKLNLFDSQYDEAKGIVQLVNSLDLNQANEKVAILYRQRGRNLDIVLKEFEDKGVPYFNGLYLQDEDPVYKDFHQQCLNRFIEFFKNRDSVSKKNLMEFYLDFKSIIKINSKSQPLLRLLKVFIEQVIKEAIWKHLNSEDRKNFIINFLMGKGLKNYIEYVKESVIISTVFGAKGLEWEYVIIPDLEKDSIPNYMGMCKGCSFKQNCRLIIDEDNEKSFIDELGVFYVALTRARIQTYFTASEINGYGYRTNITCFLKLQGISMNINKDVKSIFKEA